MQFDSVAAALAMDGHGAYVWPVFLVALLVVIGLLWLPMLKHRQIAQAQRAVLRREQAQTPGRENASGS